MALKYTLKTKRIWIDQQADEYIEVRGIGLSEAAQLLSGHTEQATMLFDKLTAPKVKGKTALSEINIEKLLSDMIVSAPAMVTHLIALASDETEQFDLISKLPVDVQFLAVEAIATLTFASNGGTKNFLETVFRMLASTNGLADQLRNAKIPQSMNGSQDSTGTVPS